MYGDHLFSRVEDWRGAPRPLTVGPPREAFFVLGPKFPQLGWPYRSFVLLTIDLIKWGIFRARWIGSIRPPLSGFFGSGAGQQNNAADRGDCNVQVAQTTFHTGKHLPVLP